MSTEKRRISYTKYRRELDPEPKSGDVRKIGLIVGNTYTEVDAVMISAAAGSLITNPAKGESGRDWEIVEEIPAGETFDLGTGRRL